MTTEQARRELKAALMADELHKSYKISTEALKVAVQALERMVEEQMQDCLSCKHQFKDWCEEPCDSCTEGHSNFEEATE